MSQTVQSVQRIATNMLAADILRPDLPCAVHGAAAGTRGLPLFSNGHLGVDLLYVPPHGQFPLHVHPGHHLLLCLKGAGTFTIDGVVHAIAPGDLYMVDAQVPHAVGAGPDPEGHYLLSFGAPHTPVDSPERMRAVVVEDEPAP